MEQDTWIEFFFVILDFAVKFVNLIVVLISLVL